MTNAKNLVTVHRSYFVHRASTLKTTRNQKQCLEGTAILAGVYYIHINVNTCIKIILHCMGNFYTTDRCDKSLHYTVLQLVIASLSSIVLSCSIIFMFCSHFHILHFQHSSPANIYSVWIEDIFCVTSDARIVDRFCCFLTRWL